MSNSAQARGIFGFRNPRTYQKFTHSESDSQFYNNAEQEFVVAFRQDGEFH